MMTKPAIVDLDGILYRIEEGFSDDAPLVEDLRSGYPPGRGEFVTLSVCRITGWSPTGDRPATWSGPMAGTDQRLAPIAACLGYAVRA